MSKAKSHSLQDISSLLSSSFELFKKQFLSLFIYNVIGFAGYALFLVVLGILFFLAFGRMLFAKDALSTPHLPASIAAISVGAVIFIVGILLIGTIIHIGSIKIVSGNKKSLSYIDLIKSSFPLIMPLFLTQLLVAFFTLGGAFVLVIPVIILGFLFSFVGFEVVLQKRTYLEAIKRSTAIVEHNFWPIVGRLLLITIIGLVMGAIGRSDKNSGLNIVIGIASFVFSLYQLCYTYLLYKEAENDAPQNKRAHMRWIYIVSAVGWIVLIVIIVSAVRILMSPGFFNNFNHLKNAPKLPPQASYSLLKK